MLGKIDVPRGRNSEKWLQSILKWVGGVTTNLLLVYLVIRQSVISQEPVGQHYRERRDFHACEE
jgi:Trk-type K+ transport system membrane component